ncbi:MAG TPA: hypothetical protein VFO86_11340 [Terriglobia bacterium]|nr:hypothetical protein [Terriglobia bacterium]
MNRPLLICAFFALSSSSVFAQSDPTIPDKVKQDAQPQYTDQKAEADRLKSQQALSDFLNAQSRNRKLEPGETAELDARFLEFRMAIPRFREATMEFGQNLGMKSKLDKDLKNIETQVDIFLRYLNAAKVNHPRVDAQEFKDFSPSELQWETLNSAEYIASVLDFAVALERRDVVSTEAQKFMYTLDGQLLRLKWLTTHTK